MLECWWPPSSVWNTKGETCWVTWKLLHGNLLFLWDRVRIILYISPSYYICALNLYVSFYLLIEVLLVVNLLYFEIWSHDLNMWRYLRDFEVETIGLKETSRRCSDNKCGARLKDTVLDWEVFLFACLVRLRNYQIFLVHRCCMMSMG